MADDDTYHVIEKESPEAVDQDIARLDRQLTEEREQRLSLWSILIIYRRRTRQEL